MIVSGKNKIVSLCKNNKQSITIYQNIEIVV